MFSKRISIFTGHFGSGKTEVALNYTFRLSETARKTAIVDIDIVNPFFRTADVRQSLEAGGIKVITPVFASTNVDVPSLPPEINMLFEDKEYMAVFDVGGDDLGARALARYSRNIIENDYEMYFVINTKRPMTKSEKGIKEMIAEIEASSRLKVTWLVNNTNLLQNTTAEDLIDGGRMIETVSRQTGIPVGFVSGMRPVLENYDSCWSKDGATDDNKEDRLYMDKYIRLPWEKENRR